MHTQAELQQMINRSQFHKIFNLQVLAVDNAQPGLTIKATQSASVERQPGTDQWHGGAIAALIDIAGCYALMLIASDPLPTINFRTDYLRPAINTDLLLTAHVRQAGRSVGVVDVDVDNDLGKLIALGRGSYSMRPFEAPKSQG